MLIDDVTIKIKAGNGGKGCVAFQKNVCSLGPTGGSGGRGGNLYFVGVSDLSALKQFRFKKEITAGDGEAGRRQFLDGASGTDVTFKIPVGTIVNNLNTRERIEIIKIGEPVLMAKGGLG